MMSKNSEIERLTTEIRLYKQHTVMDIIEIGRRLLKLQGLLEPDKWWGWLDKKIEINNETAKRFISAANDCTDLAVLEFIPPKDLFVLLVLPREQSDDSIELTSVKGITAQEFGTAIKDKKEAERRANIAEEQVKVLTEKVQRLLSDNLASDEGLNKLSFEEAQDKKALPTKKDKVKTDVTTLDPGLLEKVENTVKACDDLVKNLRSLNHTTAKPSRKNKRETTSLKI